MIRPWLHLTLEFLPSRNPFPGSQAEMQPGQTVVIAEDASVSLTVGPSFPACQQSRVRGRTLPGELENEKFSVPSRFQPKRSRSPVPAGSGRDGLLEILVIARTASCLDI